jgi:NAD(P)-dependent dehydrogenase (short-subunit alcohol dehydrogenase family)
MDTAPLPRPPVALITGANTGIGRVTAVALARAGWRVFVATRSRERTQATLDEIAAVPGAPAAEWLALDLGDFASVRACAASFLARGLPLQLLINNAGVAGERGRTASGFERAFGTNHLGHFLLTQCLLARLQASAPARVVTVSSAMHRQARGIDWDALTRPTASRTGVPEYRVAKLANALFSAELGRRLAGTGVVTAALHPGIVATDIWRHVPAPVRPLLRLLFGMITPEEGARTTLHCALAPQLEPATAGYFVRSAPATPSALAQDRALAAELWRRSEAWVAQRS